MLAFSLSFTFTFLRVETLCYEKCRFELLRKFFIISCNLNGKLVAAEYLSSVADNDYKNYKVFESFSRKCSSTLLCIMHSLGHCGEDQTLVEIISHLEVRMCFEHEEDDAGGYIANFMRHIRNGRERGKKN